jgi:hypothetical protein
MPLSIPTFLPEAFHLLFQHELPQDIQIYDMMGRLVTEDRGPFHDRQYLLNLDAADGSIYWYRSLRLERSGLAHTAYSLVYELLQPGL